MSDKAQENQDNSVNNETIESQSSSSQDETSETATQTPPSAELIAQLEAELAECLSREKDTALRARAEIDNVRRRAALDIEKERKFAVEKFAVEILPVIDSLERAIELADRENAALAPMLEGIELTLKSMLNAVGKFGIEPVGKKNTPFNPDLHQAMSIIDSADNDPNQVLDIMQKGYTLNGRLLRPAMVIVSK